MKIGSLDIGMRAHPSNFACAFAAGTFQTIALPPSTPATLWVTPAHIFMLFKTVITGDSCHFLRVPLKPAVGSRMVKRAACMLLFLTAACVATLDNLSGPRDIAQGQNLQPLTSMRLRKLLQGSNNSQALGSDYNCEQAGYNCEYYDYGANVEGTGSLGILSNLLLNQVNALSNLTPRLAARSRADSAVTGQQTASRRNTTVLIQNRPSRTAGLYTTGGVGIDPTNAAALSAGTSSAVAKNIVAIGFPVNNYGSSGESFGLVNASSGVPGLSSAARSLSGGLAVAGNRAVITTTGTFAVGPVIGVFLAGNRAGSTSQNGVATQAIGTTTNTYLQTSSLAVISPGNPSLLKQQQQNDTKPGKLDDAKGAAAGLPDHASKFADDMPYQDYYYYDDGQPGSKAKETNSAGGVSKGWLRSQDLLSQPSRRAANTRGQLNTFGAANGFGWTRGTTQNELLATGTLNSGARLRSGAFGTGASSLTASVGAVTDLQEVQCKKQKGAKDGPGDGQLVGSEQDCGPQNGSKPVPAGGMVFPTGMDDAQLCSKLFRGATCTQPVTPRSADSPTASSDNNSQDYSQDTDLLTPAFEAVLGKNMFAG